MSAQVTISIHGQAEYRHGGNDPVLEARMKEIAEASRRALADIASSTMTIAQARESR